MADEKQRITEFDTAGQLANDDYVLVDSATLGTRKFDANELGGGGGSASSLADLSDVTLNNVGLGDVFTYDDISDKWVNNVSYAYLTHALENNSISFNSVGGITLSNADGASGTLTLTGYNTITLDDNSSIVMPGISLNTYTGMTITSNADIHLEQGGGYWDSDDYSGTQQSLRGAILSLYDQLSSITSFPAQTYEDVTNALTHDKLEVRYESTGSEIIVRGSDSNHTMVIGPDDITMSGYWDGSEIHSLKEAIIAASGGGGGGSVSALDDLTDVSISSPEDGEFLIYDSGDWVNSSLSSLNVGEYFSVDNTGYLQTDTAFFAGGVRFNSTVSISDNLSVAGLIDNIQLDGNGDITIDSESSTVWGTDYWASDEKSLLGFTHAVCDWINSYADLSSAMSSETDPMSFVLDREDFNEAPVLSFTGYGGISISKDGHLLVGYDESDPTATTLCIVADDIDKSTNWGRTNYSSLDDVIADFELRISTLEQS